MTPSVRIYRALLRMYPRAFRNEYGDDMVALFEEMLRDGRAATVWWRVARDAATSIPIQHTEVAMAARISPNIVGLLSVLFFAIAITAFFMGGVSHWWLGLPGIGALLASAASALYWRSHRVYVDDDALHHRWYGFIAGGALLLGGVVVGSGLDLSVPWELLVGMVLTGWAMVAVGFFLGIWNGFAGLRRRGENGAWPAS